MTQPLSQAAQQALDALPEDGSPKGEHALYAAIGTDGDAGAQAVTELYAAGMVETDPQTGLLRRKEEHDDTTDR